MVLNVRICFRLVVSAHYVHPLISIKRWNTIQLLPNLQHVFVIIAFLSNQHFFWKTKMLIPYTCFIPICLMIYINGIMYIWFLSYLFNNWLNFTQVFEVVWYFQLVIISLISEIVPITWSTSTLWRYTDTYFKPTLPF